MVADTGIWMAIAALTGAATGSFTNVAIYRVPLMIASPDPRFTLLLPRSRCPVCEVPLRWWHIIPLLSWCMLRGRCAACQVRIGWRYPLTELLFTLSAPLLAYWLPTPEAVMMAILLLFLLWSLAVIDLRDGLLPDMLTQPLVWSGLVCSMAGIGRLSPQEAAAGAVAGWLSLWLLYWLVFYATGKEGMGYGDVKLFAGLGAWNGWEALPQILLLAVCLSLVFPVWRYVQRATNWRDAVPFGPGLAASGGFYWLAGEISGSFLVYL